MQVRTLLLALFVSLPALAQYNAQAGRSVATPEAAPVVTRDKNGAEHLERKVVDPTRDAYGNAEAAKYDLAVDGAFGGQTVLVIDLYGGQYSQPFDGPRDALKQKGFNVVRYTGVPALGEFEDGLKKSNQFWIISSCDNAVHLTPAHQKAIKKFFDEGHGVYLWGDNDPCNADADKLASMLIDARVQGDLPGDQTVGISSGPGKPGVVRDHLLSTGVEHVYEGVTVATVKPAGAMTPVIYGSAGNLVAAAFERDGKRLIVDGGFTRLSYKWDTAGTGRYIKNAGAWLANLERFGDSVVAQQFQKRAK
jgi:hypothetical protein